jgi:hypothetical protein
LILLCMSKKGQIFIIAAILLSLIIYILASVTNIARQEKMRGDFEGLSENYETEASRLINAAVSTGADVGPAFGNFTYAFTSYSKTKNPQFGLIYVLNYEGKVYMGNYLNEEIYVDVGDKTPLTLEGCFEAVDARVVFGPLTGSFNPGNPQMEKCTKDIPEPKSDKLYVAIKNTWYTFKLVSGKPQLMVVSQMEEAKQRKVFVGGEGFAKEEDHCKQFKKQECDYLEQYGICAWEKGECKQKWDLLKELKDAFEKIKQK